MDKIVQETFGNRLRVRVCGLCLSQDKLLLVNHAGLRQGPFWAPPGGGMEFGMSAEANLVNEFREETGLTVAVGPLLFVTEFMNLPLHALELFFQVTITGGALRKGHDPEMPPGHQLIQEARFMDMGSIDALPDDHKHGAFKLAGRASAIGGLNGYFRI